MYSSGIYVGPVCHACCVYLLFDIYTERRWLTSAVSDRVTVYFYFSNKWGRGSLVHVLTSRIAFTEATEE